MNQNKADPIFGLEKVPDSELIKRLKFELGVLTSEYQELHDSKYHKHAENSAYIVSLEGQVRNLKNKIELIKDNDYEKEIIELKEQIDKKNRKINVLEKELLKQLKIKNEKNN